MTLAPPRKMLAYGNVEAMSGSPRTAMMRSTRSPSSPVASSCHSPVCGPLRRTHIDSPGSPWLSPDVFSGGLRYIVLRPRMLAEREGDVAYVNFCPIPAMPRMGGEIRVVPAFFSPAGTLIEDLEVLASDGSPIDGNRGVAINVSRSKNVRVVLDEIRFDLVPR